MTAIAHPSPAPGLWLEVSCLECGERLETNGTHVTITGRQASAELTCTTCAAPYHLAIRILPAQTP